MAGRVMHFIGEVVVSLLLDGNPTRTTVESRSVRLGTGVAISLRQSALIT